MMTGRGLAMQGYAQTVARLRSMLFLLEESLRIADEGGHALVGAKVSDCIGTIQQELSMMVDDRSPPRSDAVPQADLAAAKSRRAG